MLAPLVVFSFSKLFSVRLQGVKSLRSKVSTGFLTSPFDTQTNAWLWKVVSVSLPLARLQPPRLGHLSVWLPLVRL